MSGDDDDEHLMNRKLMMAEGNQSKSIGVSRFRVRKLFAAQH
jgi:hypothetical protein